MRLLHNGCFLRGFCAGLSLFACLAAPAFAGDAANIFAPAIEKAQQRCVKIYGAGIGREPGYATGIVVSPNGHILTAGGVYLSGSRIRVILPDGSLHMAEVERRSEPLQAAILKIGAATPDYFDLPAAQPVQTGDWVIAVSNLFKIADGPEKLSVNVGVVSLRTALDARRGTQDVPYDGDVLVIDAITSNPGAPGGAVVNVDGQLVGMIGKVLESASTNTRLNYAVPADLLRKFLEGAALVVKPRRPKTGKPEIGIKLFTLSGRRAPAYVDRVVAESPAERAGIAKDDLVLSIGGETVRNVGDYLKAEAQLTTGQPVRLVIKRRNEVVTVTLELEEDGPTSDGGPAVSDNEPQRPRPTERDDEQP